MNALYRALAILLLVFAAVVLVDAGTLRRRAAGDNTYGDEPAVPTTAAYAGAAEQAPETAAVPEQEAEHVENAPVAETAAPVVESGYRAKRQAGDNTYGDEPAVPTTAGAGGGATETAAVPEQEAEHVENAPLAETAAPVVESGYRAKRQAGDNTYGDEPVVATPAASYADAELTTAAVPEEVPQAVPVSPLPGPVAGVEQSGY